MTRKIGIVIAGALAVFSLAAGLSLYSSHPVRSSDHQDSPATVARPGADLSDLYAFPAPDNDNDVVLVMNVHPIIPAGMGHQTRFDPGVMYQFKIDNTGDHVEDLVIQFKADASGSSQKIAMFGPAKPEAAGTRSAWVAQTGSVTYDKVATLGNGVKLYAGPRKDPFFFDLAQFFKIVPDRNAGYHASGQSVPAASATAFNNPGTDFLSTNRFNVLSIVAEVPRTMLSPSYGPAGKINLWATTSTADGSGYQQIERLGRPAVKEAFEAFTDHDRTNRSTPTDDRVLSDSIYQFMTTVAGRSPQIANVVRSVLIPDELAIDLSQTSVPAAYLGVETGGVTGSKFGGRGLRDDVIDLSLGVVFGNTVPALKLAPDDGKESPGLTSDHVGPNETYGKGFPYLNEPY